MKLRRIDVRIADIMASWSWKHIGLFLLLVGGLLGCSLQAEAAKMEGNWWYEVEPGQWEPFSFPNRPPLDAGQRLVRLRTVLEPRSPEHNMLLFETTNQAVRVWLGDKLLYEQGSFADVRFYEGRQSNLVSVPDLSDTELLTFELYSNTDYHLGRFNTLILDTETAQIKRLFFDDIPVVLALPVAVLMVLVMLLYYHYSPHGWKRLYIDIIGFLLVFGCWLISASTVKDLFVDKPVFWWYALSILAYLLPITANLILYELLRDKTYARMKWVVGANVLIFLLAMIGEVLGAHTMNTFMVAYYPLLAVGDGLAFYWCIRAAREGDGLCRAVLVPTAAFTFLGILDGLAGHFYLLPWRTFMTPFAIYAFMYFVIAILRQQLRGGQELALRTAGLEYEAVMAVQRSSLDVLTGCWNRSKLNEFLTSAISGSRETGQSFAVLLLDIDHFKAINDNHGHDAGDAVLKEFAQRIRQQLGGDSNCVRWGGEEFLILVNSGQALMVAGLAERLRWQTAHTPLAGYAVTCSIGAAFWNGKKDTPGALFKRVDRALYMAKEAGRNQVRFADPDW